jgi:hypothetical protein
VAPWPRTVHVWSEQGRSCEQRLADLEDDLSAIDATATAGGDCDRWDHEIPGGCLSAARLRTAVEEHGAGRQLVRFRIYPRINAGARVAIATMALLAAAVVAVDAPATTVAVLTTMAVALVARAAMEASRASGQLVRAVAQAARREGAVVVGERAPVGALATSGQEPTAVLERAEA